ncbi:MAG TPA: hypothetical protein VIK69_09635 [Methylophilaceae bacterium]
MNDKHINAGGPAFPTYASDHRGAACNTTFEPKGGMTLRDYFAAKALPEVLAQKDVHGHTREWENAAWISYQIADAMLKAREGTSQ